MPIKEQETELNQVAEATTTKKMSYEPSADDSAFDKPQVPTYCGFGEGLFAVAQLLTILIFAFVTEYSDGTHVKTGSYGDA